MQVLITGASGLVGSRIAQHLSSKGLKLRLSTRTDLSYCLPNTSICQVDWTSQESLDHSCKDIDVIIHASGMNSHDSTADPLGAFLVNGIGSSRLRLAASRAGVRRIIYFSTAHVYSNPLSGVITEECCPLNLHPYASSHLAGESALYSPPNISGPDIFVLRMSNAFGAPYHSSAKCWNLLANDLCKQAVVERSLCLATSGWQPRNFLPLSFVCTVVEKLLNSSCSQSSHQIFNLGGTSMSVRDFAKLIQRHSSSCLGIMPPLNMPFAKPPSSKPFLDYRTSKLANYLSLDTPKLDSEIVTLLSFCVDHFSR